jgi:DNA-binding transcriptional ArsR family regulator
VTATVTRFEWDRAVGMLRLPQITKHVAARLAMHADGRTGEHAHPGADRLAAECSLSEVTVRRHLKTLSDLGLIEQTWRGRGNQYGRTANEYALRLPPDILARVDRWLNENPRYRSPVTGTNSLASGLQETGTNSVRYRSLETPLPISGDLLPISGDVGSDLLETTHQSRNHGRVPLLDQSPSPSLPKPQVRARETDGLTRQDQETDKTKSAATRRTCPECGHDKFSNTGDCLRCTTTKPVRLDPRTKP